MWLCARRTPRPTLVVLIQKAIPYGIVVPYTRQVPPEQQLADGPDAASHGQGARRADLVSCVIESKAKVDAYAMYEDAFRMHPLVAKPRAVWTCTFVVKLWPGKSTL